ncbi:unnamed protein product [Durusdinium trenchii]|uniref:Uncharacterized protein n=1 Tax=Durusdinium trenchii TaxID=1381693 RepID=A0ABP0JDL1_9DINO
MAKSGDIMEAMRPKSVKELHASIAAAGRRRPLPPVANQLQTFVEQCRECEERCVSRLRERAKFEAALLPSNLQEKDAARSQVVEGVQHRFAALEGQCSVICGKRTAQ